MGSCLGNIQRLHHLAVHFFFLSLFNDERGKGSISYYHPGISGNFGVMGEHHEFSKNRLMSWQAPQVTFFVCY